MADYCYWRCSGNAGRCIRPNPRGSTADLYERIAAESKFSIHRLRITLPKGSSIPNDKSVTVASTELQDGDTIQVKDLGTPPASTAGNTFKQPH